MPTFCKFYIAYVYMSILVYIYRVSQYTVLTSREKIEGIEINKNVLYHFAIFAMVNEI